MALVSRELELAKTAGRALFDALFQKDVRDLYYRSVAKADFEGKRLTIKLVLDDAPELADVPWEYLHDHDRFLATSTRAQIVRALPSRPRTPQRVELPFRVLGIASSPSDMFALDLESEKQRFEAAIADLIRDGAIEITWLAEATTPALIRELRRTSFHVVSFIGHGRVDAARGESALLLEDEAGRSSALPGMYLGTLLRDDPTIRLAVLNAPEGARAEFLNPFGEVATDLVKCGIPAVVATQFEMSDDASTLFTRAFYSGLVDGGPVDLALAEARQAVWADDNDAEWGTPMLFLGDGDGQIFDVGRGA